VAFDTEQALSISSVAAPTQKRESKDRCSVFIGVSI
jgi:hypothetical protein